MQLFRDQNKIREYIEVLLAEKDSEDLKFKHASGGFLDSFGDTYSVFANTEGGTIIFCVVGKIFKEWNDTNCYTPNIDNCLMTIF